MSTKGALSLMRIAFYVAFFSSLASFLAFRHFGEWTAATVHTLLEYDYGNAIAALVAVAGYLLEHYISRKSSMLEKQMERVEAQSHQLLVPLTMQWHALWLGSVAGFVDKHAGEIMSRDEHREALAKYQMMNKTLGGEKMLETPTSFSNNLTHAMMMEVLFCKKGGDKSFAQIASKNELPLLLHNEIQNCDRDSKLWKSYENFVRHSFVPAVEKIADIIDEEGHLMEPVPASRLKEIFGTEGTGYGHKWDSAKNVVLQPLFVVCQVMARTLSNVG
mmetsp:Transcript_41462/g.88348  ORF Transcript_41462/g.88348 Transcript_41462/m.88348 type:complete len:275 (+) Transcript_41462:28-852(+)